MDAHTVCAHARWRVGDGLGQAFVAFWTDESAATSARSPRHRGTGVLVQSLEDPRSQELFDRARELCVEMHPGAYRRVATA